MSRAAVRPPVTWWAVALGVGALVVSTASVVWSLVLNFRSPDVPEAHYLGSSVADAVWATQWLPYSVVGALIVPRHPRLLTGWLLVGSGVLMGAANVANFSGLYALRVAHVDISPVVPWLAMWLWAPAILALTTFLPLTFPDGRLPSARWRPVAWTAAAAMLLVVGPALTLRPGHLDWPFADVENPFGVGGAVGAAFAWIGTGPGGGRAVFVWMAAIVGSFAAAIVRFRRSRGLERQQLKWFLSAVPLLVLMLPVGTNYQRGPFFFALFAVTSVTVFGALAAAVGIAVLRYRLYDVDLVINRALVYGALTVALGAAYWGGVVVLQAVLRPLTQGSELAVAASTLVVAALFQPLRRWIQGVVDRRFYRRKYDAARTLEAFGQRLRAELELEALGGAVREVARTTMQPAHVSLWLRNRARRSG